MVNRPSSTYLWLLRLAQRHAALLFFALTLLATTHQAAFGGAIVGDKPQFSASTLSGNQFDSSDLQKRIVLVYFWRSDYASAQAYVPKVRHFYDHYNKHGLEVVGVSRDRFREQLIDHLKSNRTPWPQILDSEQDPPLSQALACYSLTDAMLFSPEGTLIWRGHINTVDKPLRDALARFAPKALDADGQIAKYVPTEITAASISEEDRDEALSALRAAHTAMKQNNLRLMTKKLQDVQIASMPDDRVIGQAQLLRRQLDRHLADWPHFKSAMEKDPTAFHRLEELIQAGDQEWESPASPLDLPEVNQSSSAPGMDNGSFGGETSKNAAASDGDRSMATSTPAVDTAARDAELAEASAARNAEIEVGREKMTQANAALLEGRFASVMDLIDAVPTASIGDPEVTAQANKLRSGFASKAQTSPTFRTLLKDRTQSIARFRQILEGKPVSSRAADPVANAHPLVIEEKLRDAEEARVAGKHGQAYEAYLWLAENAIDGPSAIAHTHLAQYRSDKAQMAEIRLYLAGSALAKAEELEEAGEKEQARLLYESVASEFADMPAAKRAEIALARLQ